MKNMGGALSSYLSYPQDKGGGDHKMQLPLGCIHRKGHCGTHITLI